MSTLKFSQTKKPTFNKVFSLTSLTSWAFDGNFKYYETFLSILKQPANLDLFIHKRNFLIDSNKHLLIVACMQNHTVFEFKLLP